MKKSIFTFAASLFLTVCLSLSTYAHFPINVSAKSSGLINAGFTPFQFSILPTDNAQLCGETADVYGVAIGVLAIEQKSAIVSYALFNFLQENYFLQTGLFNVTEINYGLSLSTLEFADINYGLQTGVMCFESRGDEKYQDSLPGVQVGLINIGSGIQFGLINFNTDGFLSIFPLFNFAIGKNKPKSPDKIIDELNQMPADKRDKEIATSIHRTLRWKKADQVRFIVWAASVVENKETLDCLAIQAYYNNLLDDLKVIADEKQDKKLQEIVKKGFEFQSSIKQFNKEKKEKEEKAKQAPGKTDKK